MSFPLQAPTTSSQASQFHSPSPAAASTSINGAPAPIPGVAQPSASTPITIPERISADAAFEPSTNPHPKPEAGKVQPIEKKAESILEEQFWAARREEEIARRDRSLVELLAMLDGYKPLIPEEITEYFLQRSGFDCNDPRLKKLLSLVAQKFLSDLSKDAFHFSKLRVNGASQGRGRPAAGVDRNKIVLTMDDLSLALGEHGVNVKAPDYCTFRVFRR
nr:hypothetical protein L204_02878 [Cryptococcus depauperatus CBS 7855]